MGLGELDYGCHPCWHPQWSWKRKNFFRLRMMNRTNQKMQLGVGKATGEIKTKRMRMRSFGSMVTCPIGSRGSLHGPSLSSVAPATIYTIAPSPFSHSARSNGFAEAPYLNPRRTPRLHTTTDEYQNDSYLKRSRSFLYGWKGIGIWISRSFNKEEKETLWWWTASI